MNKALFIGLFIGLVCGQSGEYRFGVGIYDITGPAAEVGMMGYAMPQQISAGISFRLRSRAFLFANTVDNKRVVFVSTDTCMIMTGVKAGVIQKLQQAYGDIYSHDNVMMSGTHTHSGPAGYSSYTMYDITSLGFHQDNYDVIVNGIFASIQQAHEGLSKGGTMYMNSGILLDSNANRSPSAYLNNPAEERAKYQYNVEKEMKVIKLVDETGKELGLIDWFAVHGTSMNNTNTFISGDNKGYASYLFEKYKNGKDTLPGKGPFVAAFAQEAAGDVSPNTMGAYCGQTNIRCDFDHSTCDGYNEQCIARGPGVDMWDSTRIIGNNQFKKALDLYNSATTVNSVAIDYVHTFLDFGNISVSAEWTTNHQAGTTCHGSLGDAFAAGTTDGPGAFDFVQGTNSSSANPYWNYIGNFLSEPTQQEIDCQFPKPILLNTGDVSFPTPWTPRILPLQIFRIGDLVILGTPAEFTTMSGRRLKATVRSVLEQYGLADNNTFIAIAGLSNAYSHYVTTYEEFHIQRYEGASTLYGPNTLAAYQQEFASLADALAKNIPVPPGPSPPDLTGKVPNFLPPVLFDAHPMLGHFGDIYQDVNGSYHPGDTAVAIFYGANPRNDFQTEKTFLTVEKYENNAWNVILTDGDFETRFQWQMHLVAESLITITWEIPTDQESGTYRLQTFGVSKDIFGTLTPYVGTSSTFTVQ